MDGTPRRSVRLGLRLCLIGSVVFWVGLPWPVVIDFFDADGEAAQIALIEDQRGQFALAFGLLGLGGKTRCRSMPIGWGGGPVSVRSCVDAVAACDSSWVAAGSTGTGEADGYGW